MITKLFHDINCDLRANGFPHGGAKGFFLGYVLHAGCYVLIHYRLMSVLIRGNAPSRFVARLIAARLLTKTGCFLSPSAMLKPGVIMPHATGVIIGMGVRIASGVTIYQGVTLGESKSGCGRYPDVQEGAVIYAGAKVIGSVRVGYNAVVGANSVVMCDVPDGSTAVGAPARLMPRQTESLDALSRAQAVK